MVVRNFSKPTSICLTLFLSLAFLLTVLVIIVGTDSVAETEVFSGLNAIFLFATIPYELSPAWELSELGAAEVTSVPVHW